MTWISTQNQDVTSADPSKQMTDRAILPAFVAAAVILTLASLALELANSVGTKETRVLKDAAAVYKFPIFAGFVTHIGVYVLVATAAVTAFAATLRVAHPKRLFAVAVLSGLLAFDDMYLFHERVGPWLLGTSEEVVMLVYAVIALGIAFQFKKTLFARAQWPLLLAGVALFISAVIDMDGRSGGSVLLIEDMSKLTGYALWFGFWMTYVRTALRAGSGGIE